MTAVEWLSKRTFIPLHELEQAKQMEKEQIEHAYKTCWQDYGYEGKHWEMGMDPNETFKSYYDEIYGK